MAGDGRLDRVSCTTIDYITRVHPDGAWRVRRNPFIVKQLRSCNPVRWPGRNQCRRPPVVHRWARARARQGHGADLAQDRGGGAPDARTGLPEARRARPGAPARKRAVAVRARRRAALCGRRRGGHRPRRRGARDSGRRRAPGRGARRHVRTGPVLPRCGPTGCRPPAVPAPARRGRRGGARSLRRRTQRSEVLRREVMERGGWAETPSQRGVSGR